MNNFQIRFIEATEIPTNLPPVTGWKHVPSLSFEESVKGLPIPHINDNVEFYLDVGDNFVLENDDSVLTKDEFCAIYLYTLEVLHKPLNATLNEKEDRNDKIKPYHFYIKLINSALEKLPRYRDNVWRGVKTDKDFSGKYVKGKKIVWWSYTSTSKEGKAVQNFLGETGHRLLFQIRSKTGVDITKYSAFKNEAEILFAMGTKFQVKNVVEQDKLTIIELEELSSIFSSTVKLPK